MTKVSTAIAFGLICVSVQAQWINQPTPGIPRTADGKPNLRAPVPQAQDGLPDLSGIWGFASGNNRPNLPPGTVIDSSQGPEFSLQYYRNGAAIPMTPWAEAIFRERDRTFGRDRPSGHCLPHGIPDAMLPSSFKIVQNPGLTLILYEEFARFRQIFTDGRSHPRTMNPAWLGYSIGKWDRDTFVVDTIGFNDRSWLDDVGHPHSEDLHTIERFRRLDFGHMEMEVRIEDRTAYTEPWSVALRFALQPDTELIEDVCDNERDMTHAVGSISDDVRANIRLTPELLSEYAGTYQVAGSPVVVEIVLAGTRLVVLGEAITPISESKFSGSRGIYEFIKDDQGRVTRFILAPIAGGEIQLIRKPAPAPKDKE